MEIIPAIIPETFRDLEEKIALVKGLVDTVQIDFCDDGFFLRQPLPFTQHLAFNALRSAQGSGRALPQGLTPCGQGAGFTDALDYEAHLMVTNPRSFIDDLVRAGFSRILVQVEALSAESLADAIHEWRGSVEIAPSLELGTPLEAVGSFAHELTTLQLMGIAKIGAQGRPFDERVVARVGEAHARFPRLAIAVDGGVSLTNARVLLDAGANRLVVGSAIFQNADRRGLPVTRIRADVQKAIEQFKQLR